MSYTSVTDIVYNPEVIKKIIGQKWIYDAKVFASGIMASDNVPMEGLIETNIMQKRFEDVAGQAAAAGATLTLSNRTQVAMGWPVIFRYGAIEEPMLAEEVEKKGVDMMNASFAEGAAKACAQYIDDSAISAIEGVAANLTANQYDPGSSTDVTLAGITTTKAKLGDNSSVLSGGAAIMRSEKELVMLNLGLIAATSNTFGNAAQDQLVRSGQLPVQLLGMTPIVSDKVSKETGGDYYTYFVGKQALYFGYSGSPDIRNLQLHHPRKVQTWRNGNGLDGCRERRRC
jgi:hypothetical protein